MNEFLNKPATFFTSSGHHFGGTLIKFDGDRMEIDNGVDTTIIFNYREVVAVRLSNKEQSRKTEELPSCEIGNLSALVDVLMSPLE